jgi:hypothetical protein
MAIRLYPTNYNGTPFVPTTRGTWNNAPAQNRMMYAYKEQAIIGEGPWSSSESETSATSPFRSGKFWFVGPKLDAQTISGTFDMCWSMRSTVAGAMAVYAVHIYVVTPTNTVRGTLLSNYIEPDDSANYFPIGTSYVGQQLSAPQALTSVACLQGDRIVIEWGTGFYNTSTTSFNAGFIWGGSDDTVTDVSDGDISGLPVTEWSWFEFSNDLVLSPTEPLVSQMQAEVLVIPSSPSARTSQLMAEVLTIPAGPEARISQLYAEVLTSPVAQVLDVHRATIIIIS